MPAGQLVFPETSAPRNRLRDHADALVSPQLLVNNRSCNVPKVDKGRILAFVNTVDGVCVDVT